MDTGWRPTQIGGCRGDGALTGGTAAAQVSASSPDSSLPVGAVAAPRSSPDDALRKGVASRGAVRAPEEARASSAVVAGAGDSVSSIWTETGGHRAGLFMKKPFKALDLPTGLMINTMEGVYTGFVYRPEFFRFHSHMVFTVMLQLNLTQQGPTI